MSEKVKIEGVIGQYGDGDAFPVAFRCEVELPLRDLFAALALPAIIQADFARSISRHPESAVADAYRFADAAIVTGKGNEG